jgi:hypothetical protein
MVGILTKIWKYEQFKLSVGGLFHDLAETVAADGEQQANTRHSPLYYFYRRVKSIYFCHLNAFIYYVDVVICTAVATQWLRDRTVSEQRLGTHVPAETNTHLTIDLLWKRDVFYVARAKMLWAGQSEGKQMTDPSSRQRERPTSKSL